jgi:preprotein translocase subunit SecF
MAAKEITEASEDAAELTSDSTAALPHHSFLSRLYTGTGAFEVVGRRRLWYGISGAIVAVAILSILVRGFTFGIDFKGGTTMSMPAAGGSGMVQTSQVSDVFKKTLGHDPASVVTVGSGASATVQISSEALSNDQTSQLRNALFDAFQPKGTDGKPSKAAISDSAVSETWGDQITDKALIALAIFLVLVSIYIMVRYERYMAISALTTMVFDLTVTAGVYSLVGFEVSPATVIGLLTILGFSLYDTVIVFDKVEENTKDFQHTARRTFAERANLAINQTFMRSINTSLISVLPVLALMVVAVWLLGVGTLKDLPRRCWSRCASAPRSCAPTPAGSSNDASRSRGRTRWATTPTATSRRSPPTRNRRSRAARTPPRPASRHRTSRRRVPGLCDPPVPGARPASGTPAGGSRDGPLARMGDRRPGRVARHGVHADRVLG